MKEEKITIEDQREYQDAVSELQIAIRKIKSLAIVYGNRYVDSANIEDRVTALYASPEVQTYLYAALIDAICDADSKANMIDA